jgi:hypothetical protein
MRQAKPSHWLGQTAPTQAIAPVAVSPINPAQTASRTYQCDQPSLTRSFVLPILPVYTGADYFPAANPTDDDRSAGHAVRLGDDCQQTPDAPIPACHIGWICVGLIGIAVEYESFVEKHYSKSIAQMDEVERDSRNQFKKGTFESVRVLGQVGAFLFFLLKDDAADGILFGSTVLVPFAVYTFDVVAVSRRK